MNFSKLIVCIQILKSIFKWRCRNQLHSNIERVEAHPIYILNLFPQGFAKLVDKFSQVFPRMNVFIEKYIHASTSLNYTYYSLKPSLRNTGTQNKRSRYKLSNQPLSWKLYVVIDTSQNLSNSLIVWESYIHHID